MNATHLRFRAVEAGGHTHVDVYAGVPGFTFARAGTLVFRTEEWPNMRELFQRGGARVAVEQDYSQQGRSWEGD